MLLPDEDDAVSGGGVEGQAYPTATHLTAVQDSIQGAAGIMSGGAVTDGTGTWELDVAQIVVREGNVETTGAADTVTLTGTAGLSSGQARRDIIVVDTGTGALSITDGTAAAYTAGITAPVLPDVPAGKALVGSYWTNFGDTGAVIGQYTDHRTFLPDGPTVAAPYQWLQGNRYGGKNRRQVIPTATWVPIHWPFKHTDQFNTEAEGTSVSVAEAVTLTGSGDTIEVASGDGAQFTTPTTIKDTWAVIEGGLELGNATYDETGGGVEDEWTLTAHGLAVDEVVHFTAVGGGASGYSINTQYKVTSVPTANTFTIGAEAGGGTIAGTGDSTGTWTLARSVCQVVKYTGISTGTGTGGNDQLTGVSLGSLSLTTADHIAQAAVRVFGETANHDGFYLFQQTCCVAFEYSGAGNAREIRYNARLNFLDLAVIDFTVFRNDAAPMSGGSGKGQHLQLAGQPGAVHGATDIVAHLIEVYQDTGSDLTLVSNGNAAPIIMQAAFTAREEV